MNPEKTCPTCGTAIPADAADGLCLKCLGRLGFFPEASHSPQGGLLRLGDYELLEEIARGGMGVVYRARQLSLNRIVALKVVLHGPFSSPDFVRRFRNEAQAVASLRHPNIVAIHEIGEHGGNHYISLEFVEGKNFADLARTGPLPPARVAQYLKIIAEAVGHAHQRGVLHRDLKPSNVLLDVFDQPRVTDFGLAKLVNQDAGLTITGQVLGSPNYMPPEQALGKFSDGTAQSDVYSLGAILYELLTGRSPFQGETLQAVLAQVQDADPVPPRQLNPGTPVDLQTICLKCLQKEPARRYDSAQELADDLGRFLENKPIRARPVSVGERTWLWCRRRPMLAAVSAALLVVVLLGVTGILVEWRQAESERIIAQNDAAQTRLNLYAADVFVASQAIQSGNLGLARNTLDRLRPKPGESDLRGFEWRYLWNRCRGNQLATLTGHTRTVASASYSPDGRFLATGSLDGTARIWNMKQQTLVTNLNIASNAVFSIKFTPDGKYLMTGNYRHVRIWNTGSWRPEKDFPGGLAALAGDILATAESSPFYWESADTVRLFNWRTGRSLGQLDRPGRTPALSPDGTLLAVAGLTSGITVWETATRKMLFDWPTKTAVWSLDFSPDGHELLSAGWSSELTLWSLDGSSPKTFSSGQLTVWSAVFSPDGKTIASTSSDQTARLWDAATLAQKVVFRGHGSEVWCAAFSPDGQFLATGGKDQNVMLWPATGQAGPPDELPHDGAFRPLFSRDGKWLATVNPDLQSFTLWNMDHRAENHVFARRLIVGFSPDSQRVASLDLFSTAQPELEFATPDNQSKTQVVLAGALPPGRQFVDEGMSPDYGFFFGIDADGLVRVWNAGTGELLHTFHGPLPPIRNAMLSPGGKRLAISVERDNVAHLYDCASGTERQLAGHIDFVSGLAFTPDGATLATGSMDGTIRLWNVASGETVASLPGHMEEATDVAFSPDGQTLASVAHGESIKLWHVPTRREVFSEAMPEAGVRLQFSPDGRRLAINTDKNFVRLLEAPAE